MHPTGLGSRRRGSGGGLIQARAVATVIADTIEMLASTRPSRRRGRRLLCALHVAPTDHHSASVVEARPLRRGKRAA